MKRKSLASRRVGGSSRVQIAAFPLVFLLGGPIEASEESVPAADHVLFMGMDVGVERGLQVCPVVDMKGSTLEIFEDGARREIALGDLAEVKTKAELVIGRVSLTLSELESERVYSPASNPARLAMMQQLLMDSVQGHTQEVAENQLREAMAAQQTGENLRNAGVPVPQSAIDAARDRTQAAANAANQVFSSSQFSTFDQSRLSGAAGSGSENAPYDAFEVRFRASAPEPIEDGYAVLRVIVRDPANPRAPAVALKFFKLPVLGREPRKIVLNHPGFPAGFFVDRFDVHIYSQGRELATNLSSDRVDLSTADAFKFLFMQHLADNRASTVPVRLVPQLLPPELYRDLSEEEANRAVFLSVNELGEVTDLELAPAEPARRDAELESLVRTIRFFPALARGTPIASKATFVLAEFRP